MRAGQHVEVLDPSRPEHLADLARMRVAWTAEHVAEGPEDPGFPDRLGEWWRRQGGRRRAWVARDDGGGAIGMANLQVFDRMPRPGVPDVRWAYVANVWVDPAHRRLGVGAALVAAVLEWCREEGMVRVVLNPSEVSRPLYRRAGFRAADDLMRLDL